MEITSSLHRVPGLFTEDQITFALQSLVALALQWLALEALAALAAVAAVGGLWTYALR